MINAAPDVFRQERRSHNIPPLDVCDERENNMVIFKKNDLRLSLLTPCLLRVEKGDFTDLPTQTVVCRDLGEYFYTVE